MISLSLESSLHFFRSSPLQNNIKTTTTSDFSLFSLSLCFFVIMFIIIKYGYTSIDNTQVIGALNIMQNHLTAGIVSNDPQFLNYVLANTISGTIYAGLLARTTAAPQQHWFGPSGDVRAGGIHTKEAIQLCWSGHREIIYDVGPSGGPGSMS